MHNKQKAKNSFYSTPVHKHTHFQNKQCLRGRKFGFSPKLWFVVGFLAFLWLSSVYVFLLAFSFRKKQRFDVFGFFMFLVSLKGQMPETNKLHAGFFCCLMNNAKPKTKEQQHKIWRKTTQNKARGWSQTKPKFEAEAKYLSPVFLGHSPPPPRPKKQIKTSRPFGFSED